MENSNKGKIIKSKSRWIYPAEDHPTDRLKIRLLLDEKIKGKRLVALEAKIDPGKVHRLHVHQDEYVIVYSIKGHCLATIGKSSSIIKPNTIIFIPPNVPHRFENNTKKVWKAVAFVIGSKSKIKNIWMEK